MAYSNTPFATRVDVDTAPLIHRDNNTRVELRFKISRERAFAPTEVVEYLLATGWFVSDYHPDTGEALFERTDCGQCEMYPWYEAVAYNYFRFMTLDSPATKSD